MSQSSAAASLTNGQAGGGAAAPVRARAYHPWLLTAWIVLDLYARNAEQVLFSDVCLPLAVLLAATTCVFGVVWLCLRNVAKSALIVSLGVVLFFSVAATSDAALAIAKRLMATPPLAISAPAVVFALVLIGIVGTIVILTRRESLLGANRLVNFTAGLLVAFAVVRLLAAVASRMVDDATESLDAPIVSSLSPPSEDDPDIYYIIVDRYACAATLDSAYGFDNSPFLDELRGRGFYVADESRCNYTKSLFSLSSSLNMTYHPEGVRTGDLVRRFRQGHVVGSLLKSRGYRYYHLGSWYCPTSSCRQADVNAHSWLGLSQFSMTLFDMTPLGRASFANHAEVALFQFCKLEEISHDANRKFVFAHILLPHPPFVFQHDGRRVSPTDRSDEKTRYLEQLRFTNTKVMHVVDAILANSQRPCVILLQADEGPFLRGDDLQRTKTEQDAIRSGILNAYYLPESSRDLLYPEISPVNSFRVVFRGCFHAEVDLLDDSVRPLRPGGD